MTRRSAFVLTGVLLGLPLAIWALHPWPVPLRWIDPSTWAYMDHRVGQARAAGVEMEIDHRWIPLERLPAVVVQAVLVAEDHRFREHRGVDWEALAEEVRYGGEIPPRIFSSAGDREALRNAWRYARENQEEIRGRSTITQQLARNLYLSPDRSFIRKGQELLIARRLEFFLSKDRILELYLNVAELGPGIFGVEAAAQRYFGVSAGDLTRFQAASLAATLPHPLTSNPESSPGRMAWRRDLILNRLAGGTGPVPPPEPDPVEVGAPHLELLPDTLPDPDPVEPPLPDPDTVVDPIAPPDTTPPPDAVVDTIARADTTPPSDPIPPRDPIALRDTLLPPDSSVTRGGVRRPASGAREAPAPRSFPSPGGTSIRGDGADVRGP